MHTKKGADEDAPKTMRVDYSISLYDTKSEWICLEHEGFARSKAVKWWRMRSNDPVPSTAQRAVDIANAGGLAPTEAITVRSVAGEKFDTIIKHELGEKPEPLPVHEAMGYSDEEIPF